MSFLNVSNATAEFVVVCKEENAAEITGAWEKLGYTVERMVKAH